MSTTKSKVSFFRSVQAKFAATNMAAILAVLALLNTYPVLVSQDLVFQSKQSSLQNQTAVIASALAFSDSLTAEGVSLAMEQLADVGFSRVLIADQAGLVLYDTSETGATLNRYALIREVTEALGGSDVFRSDYRSGVFRSRAAAPVVYRGTVVGAVYLYEYDAQQGTLLSSIQSNLRNITIIICILVAFISTVFSRALTGRINALLRAIRIVREGEYSHRVKLSGADELTELAGEFNQLTGRLQTTEEVRRRFVSDASHELKTPLASIRLLSDSILQTEGMDADTAMEFVADIGEEAERLTRITEKLLDLTRMDGKPETERAPVSVGKVVRRVERMLAPLAATGGVAVHCDVEPGCTVSATEDDLYQIIFNLMENAVKYNLPGGRVMVIAHCIGGEKGCVIIRVEDTGLGIPDEDLTKVFDRFYRVDKARSRTAGGTGLGLSIVKDTVHLHGGTVQAHRREPEGTCFVVTFPGCEKEAQS